MAVQHYSYDRLRLSRTERLPNSFASSELHTIDSPAGECLMATAVAIDSPWHHAREFGQQIVSTLVREFARSQSSSTLMRFEHALKTANHTISQAADKLGVSVHCAVALFVKEEVHFAVIGDCKLLLFRGGRLTDVTATDDGSSTRFSSVTSGDLAENEWLMVATPPTVPFLREQDNATWFEPDLDALAAQLIDQSPAEERNNFFANLIRYRADGTGQEKTVLWDNLDHITPIRLPKFSLPRFDVPALRSLTAKAQNAVTALRTRRAQRTVSQPVTESANTALHDKKPPIWQRIKAPQIFARIRNRTVIIGLVAIVLIIAIGARAITARVAKTDEASSTPTLLERFSQTAVADRINFLDEQFSFDQYGDLSEDELQTFRSLAEQAGISIHNPGEVVIEAPTSIAALDSLGTTTVALDATGRLWLIRDNKLTKVEQSILVQNPKSVAIVRDDRIVSTDAAGNIWLFDGSPTQPAALSLPSTLGTQTKTVASYAGNLYIYTEGAKTVFRQSNFDKELTALRSVGKFDSVSGSLTDWAINGQIVGISDAGATSILQAGKAIANATLPYSNPGTRLTTIESYPLLIVSAGRRVSVTDKQLGSKKDFFIPVKNTIAEITVNPNTNTVWVAAGTELYLLGF